MSRRLLAILALLAVAFAVLTAIAVQSGVLSPRQQQTAAIGGPFQMIDQTGRKVDQSLLKGKWSAVFFGFTYCPDACPTTLLALGQTEKLLGPKARDFQTVFVSLDPARDTPQQLRTYLDNETFPKKVVALTGSQAQVDQIAKAYRVFHQKSGDGDAYVIDHSTITYLMNPRGELVCPLSYGLTPAEMAVKIQAAMKQGPRAQSC